MKKSYILIILSAIGILTWCTSRSSFPLTFDEFSIKLYDNNKQYIDIPSNQNTLGIKVITEMKEKTGTGETGFINSFIIVKTAIQSWTDIKALVDSNAKTLKLKLLKYAAISNTAKKVKCDGLQYSWYITAFSYLLDKDTLYGWQYFFTDDESLYLLSLSSDEQKDITSFIKSIATLKCIKQNI